MVTSIRLQSYVVFFAPKEKTRCLPKFLEQNHINVFSMILFWYLKVLFSKNIFFKKVPFCITVEMILTNLGIH